MKILKNVTITVLFIIVSISCSSSKSGNDLCDTECEYTIAAGETAGTVASSLDGTYNLTFNFAASGAPFTDGTTGTFTINNNELTVEINGKECMTIKNPILTTAGSSEVKFKDTCRDQISYDVSEVNGKLNEINISSINGTWLGQFNDR